ncbi:MAG: PH domain-containing protein [Candidatus Moraniibacteriota bacterium]
MKEMDFSRYHFKGQRETEVILEIIHRHWFNIAVHFIIVLLFALSVFGSLFLLPFLFPELNTQGNALFFLFMQNTLLLFLWIYAFLIWIDYYFDVWIITNERVINIEQKGLFVREVSELKFSRIQDVTSEVEGLIPTVLNFGDVSVQTAAEEERFLFRQVPDPYRIKDVLMERLRNDRDEEFTRMAEAVKRGLKDSKA